MLFCCFFVLDGYRWGFCNGNLWNMCLVPCRTAATTRKAWESRFEQLESLETGKAEQKASAEVKKEQASSKLDRLREKMGKIEEKLRQLKEKERMAEKNASDGDASGLADDTIDENEPSSAPEDGINSDDYIPVNLPTPVSAEEGDKTHEETEEERAKRIASQWIPGADHENEEEIQDEEAPSENEEPDQDEDAMQQGSADYEFEPEEPLVPDEPELPQSADNPEASTNLELSLFQKCALVYIVLYCI